MRGNGFTVRMLGPWLTCLFMCAAVAAQSRLVQEATLKVAVIDPNGAVVTRARVRIKTNEGSEHARETNAQGGVLFPRLSAGTVWIEVTAEGFETRAVDGFALLAGLNQTQVQLEVASGRRSSSGRTRRSVRPTRAAMLSPTS
jgi:hypothetical protein